MAKKFTPSIVTSNHLIEGDAIYLTPKRTWSRDFGDALLLNNEEEAERALTIANARQNVHVGAYLAAAEIGPDNRPQPTHFREAFRTRGPSNYLHGKQEEAA